MCCMEKTRQQTSSRRPTRLFIKYATSLAFRSVLFALGIFLFIFNPAQLSVWQVGLAGGLNFVDVAFVFVLLDFVSKFSSRANISMGSLKQYAFFQIPTKNTVGGSVDALIGRLSEIIGRGTIRHEKRHFHPKRHIQRRVDEVRRMLVGAKDEASRELRHILHDVDFMRALPFDSSDLDVNSHARHLLRMRRFKEILPIAIFWVVLNALVALVSWQMGWLSPSFVVLWMLFFFWFDMVCVVLWCPLQLVFMRNRCCATCQIFNWDAIMVATPLIFALSWSSGILLACAIIILVRWELRAFFHPERFAEETNASLSCVNCSEALCLLRGKVGHREKDAELEQAFKA